MLKNDNASPKLIIYCNSHLADKVFVRADSTQMKYHNFHFNLIKLINITFILDSLFIPS